MATPLVQVDLNTVGIKIIASKKAQKKIYILTNILIHFFTLNIFIFLSIHFKINKIFKKIRSTFVGKIIILRSHKWASIPF